jgi:hypothetical protein
LVAVGSGDALHALVALGSGDALHALDALFSSFSPVAIFAVSAALFRIVSPLIPMVGTTSVG